jgi:hypothetical protein
MADGSMIFDRYINYLDFVDDRLAGETPRGRQEGSQGTGLFHAQGTGQCRSARRTQTRRTHAHRTQNIITLAKELLHPLHGHLRLHAR